MESSSALPGGSGTTNYSDKNNVENINSLVMVFTVFTIVRQFAKLSLSPNSHKSV